MLKFNVRENNDRSSYVSILRNKPGWKKGEGSPYESIANLKFSSSVSEYPEKLGEKDKKNLSPDEVTSLENWYSCVLFSAKNFGSSIVDLESLIYRLDPKFNDALNELAAAARKHDIDFTPQQIMLDALLEAAKKTEHAIEKKTRKKADILSKVDIDSRPAGLLYRLDEKNRGIFEALFGLPCGQAKMIKEFNATAQRYGRRGDTTLNTLEKMAYPKKGEHPLTVKKWMFSAAIDLLYENQLNPINVISADSVAQYFALQRKQEGISVEECVFIFEKRFDPNKTQLKLAVKAIEKQYGETVNV
ncbi:hypothetical protein AVI51_15080 [Piscirickettsia salmonis]|uniref:Uncharacterized protein n=1 Tax=Piscirickettsia salmonis TaxID=1238 RepID=A0A9Q5YGB0_PISSA|nr:hypothetical protein [Piscirickettsia salmonis]ALA24354.1 phosphatase [Piscirickettsia salmonis]APS44727.1 hypothetical protein AVI48_10365 [Piscirickettsia salmonis]APS48087.1 hypothetical protein AVI49_10970 [Piscirickettsia salmonis]APS52043.1 hypothetical protein AVI50_15235 [Piscirickettsia salmonis]APS55261.1 hypothetical protein AVI51_15080 [Piscirickettsia salmonis]